MPETRKNLILLQGGIGNQLFQLCYALSLEIAFPGEVCLTVSRLTQLNDGSPAYRSVLSRSYFPINVTNLPAELAVIDTTRAPQHWRYYDIPATLSSLHIGYYQNGHLVQAFRKRLQADFYSTLGTEIEIIRTSLLGKSYDYLIGLHIRRGDYLEGNNSKIYGLISEEERIQALKNRLLQLRLRFGRIGIILVSEEFIFPAEYEEFRSILVRKPSEINLPNNAIKDFVTLAACDEIFLSNSTFSYWAAVLSKSVQQFWLPSKWMLNDAVKSQKLITTRAGYYYNSLTGG